MLQSNRRISSYSLSIALLLSVVPVINLLTVNAEEGSAVIWATSDSVKTFEDSPQELENSVWSHKNNTIRIMGARNEAIAFQVVINGGKDGLSEVSVIPSELRHLNETNTIAQSRFSLFLEWFTAHYPDALIPFYNPYGHDNDIVAAFFSIEPQKNQPVWVDLYIPKDAVSGEYKGTIEVLSGGNTLKIMNLVVTVFPFTIPDERHISAYSDMYGGSLANQEGLNYNTEENWNILKEYWLMARSHRFDFNSQGYDLDLSASSKWAENGDYIVNPETWARYDTYLGQVITGAIFPDKLPPNVWRFPFPEAKYANLYGINCKYLHNATWNQPTGCYDKTYDYWENKIKSLAQTIQEHFLTKEARGVWPKGTLAKSFMYTIDEPKQYKFDYLYIKDFSSIIRKSAPQIKFMLTEQPEEPLFGSVDIWAAMPSALAPQRIIERQSKGEKVWFYQGGQPYLGSQLLTADAISLRMWAWAAWKYNIDGVFLWANNYWSNYNPYADSQVYEHGKPTDNYGDGYIFYPGSVLPAIGFPAIKGPVSSIRMKMWRRGFIDYEYLWLAKNSGREKEVNDIANSLVKSALAENYKVVTDKPSCMQKKFDGQKAEFIGGKCIGTCSDYTNKSCWYNEGIVIGPWDCDNGPDESGKYPQWWEDSRVKRFDGWSKNSDDWINARYKLAMLINKESISKAVAIDVTEKHIVYKRTRDAINLNKVSEVTDSKSRWWDKNEVAGLNVVRDLKPRKIGRDYCVDGKNGDDAKGDGTVLNPWKTISKAFDYYAGRLAPGDVIRIKAGKYRERVEIRASGTPENPILIGPYGDGEVIIDASAEVDGWSLYRNKIYQAECDFKPTAVVLDEKPLYPEFSLEKVDEGKWFYDNNNKTIYIYFPNGNPTSHDFGVISDDEYQEGVFLNNANHIVLYGITVRFAGRHGISVLGNNNRIEKCNLEFNGKAGISIWPYGDNMSVNNTVIKNHIYHNMMRNWPRGRYKWGLWTAGGCSGTPNSKFIGNVVHDNGGEGLLGSSVGAIFKDNIVYDNWSVNIYLVNCSGCAAENNFILCHEPDQKALYNNGDDNPGDHKNFRRLRAEGIMTADEDAPATFNNAKITNNIIIGCRRGITHYGKASGSGLKDVLVANNTIVLPYAEGVGEEFVGINIPFNNGNNKNARFYNNIVYGTHPKTHLLYLDTGLSVLNKDFYGLKFAHNLWYHKTNKKPFRIGPKWADIYAFDFTGWNNKCSNINCCSGDIYADPQFVDVNRLSVEGVTPKPDSPAMDAGIIVEGPISDYSGNPRSDNKPDIGALELTKK